MIRNLGLAVLLLVIALLAVVGQSGHSASSLSMSAPLYAALATGGVLLGFVLGKRMRFSLLVALLTALTVWFVSIGFAAVALAGLAIGLAVAQRTWIKPRMMDGLFAGVLIGTMYLFVTGAVPKTTAHTVACCADGIAPALLQNPTPEQKIIFLGPIHDDLFELLRETAPKQFYFQDATRGALPSGIRRCDTIFYGVYGHGQAPESPRFVERIYHVMKPDAVLVAPLSVLRTADVRYVALPGASRLGAASRRAKLTNKIDELERRLERLNERLEMPLLPPGMLHLLASPEKSGVPAAVKNSAGNRPSSAVYLYIALLLYAAFRVHCGRKVWWSERLLVLELGAVGMIAVLSMIRLFEAPGAEGLYPMALIWMLPLIFREVHSEKAHGKRVYLCTVAVLIFSAFFFERWGILLFSSVPLLMFLAGIPERRIPELAHGSELLMSGALGGALIGAALAYSSIAPAMALLLLLLV